MRPIVVALAIASFALAAPVFADHTEGLKPEAAGTPPPLYTDLGTWTKKITAANPKAQAYFDQGLRLCFGFNHDEAVRAFREAARLDAACAMAWWGIAYASGPNINLPMDEAHAKVALDAATMAKSLASGVSPLEREYIEAINVRYSADPKFTRGALDTAYMRAMVALSRRHPDDPDAAALAAEAMLDLNPWNQWRKDGKPNPGTLDAVSLLERTMKRWPEHPAANHFYIHAVEASPDPGRATAAAERLEKLVPGQGHLVHMPAHIYARIGRYDDAVTRNVIAAGIDEKYIAEQKPEGIYPLMYYNHNLQFIWFCSMMEGRSAEALAAARKIRGNLPDELIAQIPMLQMAPPYPLYTMARFGRWDEVLAEPMPPAVQRFSTGMFHYVRGLARVARGDAAAAGAELDSVREAATQVPSDLLISTNAAGALLRIASHDLAAQMAMRAGKTDAATSSFRSAIAIEDSLHYDEPPTFPWSIRPRIGQMLLDAGRAREAEVEFREDLRRHPENAWALFGLARALRAQNKERDAAAIEARFTRAWARADVKIAAATP